MTPDFTINVTGPVYVVAHGKNWQNEVITLLRAIEAQGTIVMSQLTDFRDKVEANFAAVSTGIKSLNDKITALQNSPGVLTPEDQAALDQIQADAQKLADSVTAAVPPVPPTP